MGKEIIFNIFPLCDEGIISAIGFRVHEIAGTDDEKIQFLLSRVEMDIEEMSCVGISENYKVKLPRGNEINGITITSYNTLLHKGTDKSLYESIFQSFNAPDHPLSISTLIVDGKIKITGQRKFETIPITNFTEKISEELPNHFLTEFITDEGFALDKLLNVDFFDAIRILFNNDKFVSSIKLLMVAIDTFAFLEFGDVNNNFKDWLSKYCSLIKLKITEEELWEYRNSILHMTNAFSRKVKNKTVTRLSFYVSNEDVDYLITDGGEKYYNLRSLITVIAKGIDNWNKSFNAEKFEIFCSRYDLIISDNRYTKINQ